MEQLERKMAHPSFFAAPRASHRPQSWHTARQIQEIAAPASPEMTTTFFGHRGSRCQNSLHAEEAQEQCSRRLWQVLEAMILVPAHLHGWPAINAKDHSAWNFLPGGPVAASCTYLVLANFAPLSGLAN